MLRTSQTPRNDYSPKKPKTTLSDETFSGIIKHFDEVKNYGFIFMEKEMKEMFFHYEDVIKSKGVNREFLKTCKNGNIIHVSFECVNYIGKYNLSRKAVNIHVLKDQKQLLIKNN